MSIKSILGGMGNVIASGAKAAGKGILNEITGGDDGDHAAMMQQFADQAAAQVPKEPAPTPFELPKLDDSLSNEGQKRKAEFETKNPGQPYTPTQDDYNDSGEFGYTHKKGIHDALMAMEQEMQANAPHVDYEGIMKSRLKDLASMPPEHKNNPLLMFAMALGNPEHAQELVKAYQGENAKANEADLNKWKELLQTKQDAIKGAMQQAMQAGDMKTIVSKKWADQLMEIEHAKAQLEGQKALAAEKGLASANSARIRGEWALKAVEARTKAMLSAVDIKSDSAEYRAALDSATRRLNTRINKGQDPETAYEDVMQEMHDDFDHRVPVTHGGTFVPSHGAASTGKPAPPVNPLEAAAAARRATKPQ